MWRKGKGTMISSPEVAPITRAVAIALTGTTLSAACASAPKAPPVTAVSPVASGYEQKMASILRLEDQRVLRDPPPPQPIAPSAPALRRNEATPVVQPPDLVRLLS